MGKIYLGTNEITTLEFGQYETQLQKVYLGTTEVWSGVSVPNDWVFQASSATGTDYPYDGSVSKPPLTTCPTEGAVDTWLTGAYPVSGYANLYVIRVYVAKKPSGECGYYWYEAQIVQEVTMIVYVFVDTRHPTTNLILASTYDADMELEKVEVDVEDGESVIQKVKEKLGLQGAPTWHVRQRKKLRDVKENKKDLSRGLFIILSQQM